MGDIGFVMAQKRARRGRHAVQELSELLDSASLKGHGCRSVLESHFIDSDRILDSFHVRHLT